jgi:hypothetical protein
MLAWPPEHLLTAPSALQLYTHRCSPAVSDTALQGEWCSLSEKCRQAQRSLNRDHCCIESQSNTTSLFLFFFPRFHSSPPPTLSRLHRVLSLNKQPQSASYRLSGTLTDGCTEGTIQYWSGQRYGSQWVNGGVGNVWRESGVSCKWNVFTFNFYVLLIFLQLFLFCSSFFCLKSTMFCLFPF